MKSIVIIVLILIFYSIAVFAKQEPKKNDTLKTVTKEIVVTALRYPEANLEVPLAVSVIEKQKLSDIRGCGIDEALARVPGVLAQSRYGNSDVRITIRGFGARGAGDRSNAGTSRGIKFLMDGVPETEPDGRTSFDNIDLGLTERIEIIRSNASALWGNAAGGVVSFTTIPSTREPFVRAGVGGGSFGYERGILQAAYPSKNGLLSTGFSWTKYAGYRANSAGERALLNIGLMSVLSDKSYSAVYIQGVSNRYEIPGPLTQVQFDSMPSMANPTYEKRNERRYNRGGKIAVTYGNQISENNTITSLVYLNPKYLQRSERGTFRDFTRYHVGGNFNFRNSKEFSSFKNIFLAGIDESFQDGAILFYGLTADDGRGALQQDKREGANSMGAYFQNEIIFTDKLSLLLGGRYDKVNYYYQMYYENGVSFANKSENKLFDKFTPKGALSWRLSDKHSIYMSVGGGIEVPAGNETDPDPLADTVYLINPLLKPIESTTYELGDKFLSHFENSFISDLYQEAALYLINTKNDIIPYSGGKFYFTAGKTQRAGLEYSLRLDMQYGLSIGGNLTYAMNKYIDYVVDSVHYKNPGHLADYSKNKMAGLPDMYYSASIRYVPEFFRFLYIDLSLNGVGNYFADDANKYEVPAYNILNLNLGMNEPIIIAYGMNIKAYLVFNNLTNVKYVGSSYINPDLEAGTKRPLYLEPGLPFNMVAGVTLGWK